MGLTLWSAAKKVAATIQAVGGRFQTSKSTTGLLDVAKTFLGALKDQSKQLQSQRSWWYWVCTSPPAHKALIN
jgi:hypothetical protein